MIYIESGVTGTYGADHPRIAWNSATRRGTITASSAATGFAAVNVGTPTEYDYWKATATTAQWLQVDFDATETVNAVCLTAHNLGTAGATVRVQESDGVGGWNNIGPSVVPADDSPIAILLADRNLDEIRVSFTGMSVAPYVGVLYVCEVLEFPVQTYVAQGAPANMSRRSEFMTNETINGKWVGRTLRRSRNWIDIPIAHFSETWAAANFDAFAEDARYWPYFAMAKPSSYPNDVLYKWAQGDLVPERIGIGGNLMQVTI